MLSVITLHPCYLTPLRTRIKMRIPLFIPEGKFFFVTWQGVEIYNSLAFKSPEVLMRVVQDFRHGFVFL